MSNRSNLWAFIAYPDSLPDNWLNIIDDWHLPVLVSPLHDKDLNPLNDEKKPHYHIMIYFGVGANKSFEQVSGYSKKLNATIPIIVNSSDAMIRYFIHKDNPEKHPYSITDLKAFGGFEYMKAFTSFSDDEKIYETLENLINEYCITNLAHFVLLLKSLNKTVELSFLRRHTLYFKYIIDAKFHLLAGGKKDDKE